VCEGGLAGEDRGNSGHKSTSLKTEVGTGISEQKESVVLTGGFGNTAGTSREVVEYAEWGNGESSESKRKRMSEGKVLLLMALLDSVIPKYTETAMPLSGKLKKRIGQNIKTNRCDGINTYPSKTDHYIPRGKCKKK